MLGRKLSITAITALALSVGAFADQHAEPDPAIRAAVAAEQRPDADTVRDDDRKPAEVLAFFDVQPGHHVLDLLAGNGYYTEILSRLVGPNGHVVSHNDNFYYGFVKDDLPARFGDNRLPNVEQVLQEPATLDVGTARFDRAIMILAFHDLYAGPEGGRTVPMDVPAFLAAVKKSLKPGGIFGVVEHVAPAGTGTAAGNTLHRMEPALIIEQMLAAGFELDAEADFLANPADDGTGSPFAPAIRGKTDRVVLRFKKPDV